MIFGYNGFTQFDQKNVDPVVVHAYEAVLMYGLLVAQMHREGADYSSGALLSNYTMNFTFESPITGKVYLDDNSDREIPYIMRAFSEQSQKHETLLGFPLDQSTLVQLGTIRFVNRPSLPPNIVLCLDRAHCTTTANSSTKDIVIAIVVTFVCVLALGAFVAAWYLKRHHRSDLDPYWWRILITDLQPYMHHSSDDLQPVSSQITDIGSQTGNKDSEVTKQKHDTANDKNTGNGGMNRTMSFHGQPITLLECAPPHKRVPFQMIKEAFDVKNLLHPNVQKFSGVVVNDDNICDYVAMEYCQRGSLGKLIAEDTLDLDWQFKQSLIMDLIQGLAYLHTTVLASHGFLSDTACQVDSRFVLKISDYGLPSLRHEFDLQPVTFEEEYEDPRRNYRMLLWRAPELLRRRMPENGTQKGDVYSFAILLQQIILQSLPFQLGKYGKARVREEHSLKDIILEVKRGLQPPLRPPVPTSACVRELHDLLEECWEEDPSLRWTFIRIRQAVGKIFGKSERNLVGHLINRMEQYASSLEHQVEQKTKQFMEERQRSADVLEHILPPSIAQALSRGIHIQPETFSETTVYFGDVTGYAEAVEKCNSPLETVSLLNDLYNVCDSVVFEYDVYKVEAVNDAYLVVSGLPVRNGKKHVEQIANMALTLRKRISDMKLTSERTKNFKLRAGIHSGPCVAGIIGSKLPRYCLFGDTVNTASRMESHGEGGKLHCSEAARNLLKEFPEFILVERGVIPIKGKGPMQTFWLIGN
ncbi:atrial natriuretic peptide receptor 1-like [Paramacrobiotus metropolitanus]|uniref:atrial natriuretic peptide receptor 1-like n=1 Tax=Paramacrobiotus metropolitanus TaxID=2943436 RepID=UPI002445AACF|nr:atrial natriuretic peptide receptor 1-like [Paramacrobiotus metropolitanus]